MKKIYLFAAIFALVAGLATYFFINSLQHNSAVTGVEEAEVVIAAQDIEKGTPVTAEMFTVQKIPVTAVTPNTVSKVNDIVGYIATGKIFRGEQIVSGKLAKTGGGYRLSYDLQNGYYAYSIAVTETTAVGYFVKDGDFVNIYSPQDPKAEEKLKNVEVLSISTYSDNQLQSTGTEITAYTVMTLKLTKEQLDILTPIDSTQLKIALVSYTEGAGISDELAAIKIPEDQPQTPAVNEGNKNLGVEMTLPDAA